MSRTALATSEDLQDDIVLKNSLASTLTDHAARTFATAHQVIHGMPATYYDDSGDVISDHVLSVLIGGVTYYIPCTVVIGNLPLN
jgi:hypothetical protein